MLSVEHNIFAQIVPSAVGGAVKNGINISLKYAHRALIFCIVEKAGNATQVTWTLAQSSGNAGSAAGTGEKAMTESVPIYICDNAALTNVFTAATAAKVYTNAVTASVTQVVVFQVDPELCMDLANGFDCVTVNSGDPGATNSVYAFALIEPRYNPLPSVYAD